MIKNYHKILSLVLCFALVILAACAGTVAVIAATGDTVYVRLNNGWSRVYCYMWADGIGENRSWPGVEMTKVEAGVYSYSVSGDFDKIIFNNGSGGNGNQTADLIYAGNGKIYDLSTGLWADYKNAPSNPTVPTTTVPKGEGTTVYCKNEASWSNVYCYMWNSNTDNNNSWPGIAMTNVGDDIYKYEASKIYKNCIFNNGSGTQTNDLTAMDGYIFNNKTNTWSVYNAGPIQVKSFKADPSTGIYVDSDVTLSAIAENTSGAEVTYKFSVTNSNGGTSVISDFSTDNSVIWTPAAAGNYTVSFDFKDTKGNKDSRTLNVKVEDDSLLVQPVIKSVDPANLNLIPVNREIAVFVKAGGGKTGTNLLFYKFIVTDPNGVKNIPYYTLDNTYYFTPKMEGEYTVNVYVQGSDNSTVNKTYSYTAVSSGNGGSYGVKGDADGDGIISIKDATFMQKYIVKMSGYHNINVSQCDMDKDGKISINDVTAVQKILVKLV